MPGKVYAAVLPDDLSGFNEDHQLELTVLKDGMLKNHGYYRILEDGVETALVSADNGVFQFFPPETAEGEWKVEQLLNTPASDATMVDMDGDGEKEMLVLSPFHGDTITIYKKKDGKYESVYEFEEKADFLHAIYGGTLCGEPVFIIGHRKAKRNLMVFTYNKDTASYEMQIVDEDCGSANCTVINCGGKDVIIATNREIDEVAYYTVTK